MGTAQQVYCAIAGDFQGGPASKTREDRSGTTRTAMNTFWSSGNGFTTQNRAIVILGDIVGADYNSATWLREQDVWGGGDETPAETFTCHGQTPALTVRGSGEWCMDHPGGPGAHTGYMNEAIRNVALPIPGNHDRYSRPNGGTGSQFRYDGYYTWWRDMYASDTGTKLRPNDMGLKASGTPEQGPYYYYKDLPAPDGNSYWRVILVDVSMYIDPGNFSFNAATEKTAFQNWLSATLADAATTGKHVIVGWHEPPFLVNNGGGNTATAAVLQIMQSYTAGFMILTCGHVHQYSRWNPIRYNPSFLHNQEPITVANYQNGVGAIMPLVIGTGGQTPGGFDGATAYWANIATATTGNCRPKAGVSGQNKAAVTATGSTGIQVLGEADAITDTVTGQPGHPFGVAGFILDQNSFKIQFWGGRAPYGNTPDVLKYDESQLFTWQGAVVPVPTITSFTPATGVVGTPVTIVGTNFTGATNVSFAGSAATFSVTDSTHIAATVPNGAITGTISVTTPDGIGTSAASFTVITTSVVAAWRSAELYGGGGLNTVAFDPAGTRVIGGGDNNGAKTSVDGGVNWTQGYGGQSDSTAATWMQTIAMGWSENPSFPDRVWKADASGLKASVNGGSDWKDCPTGPAFSHGPDRPHIAGHCLADDGAGRVYMIDNAGILWRYSGIGADGSTGTMTSVWSSTEIGTSIQLDPSNINIAYVTTRNGIYQLENIQTGTAPTVRKFTGTNSPTRAEEVSAVSVGGFTLLFVAAYNQGILRITAPAPGGTGVITTSWDVCTPPNGGTQWCAVDALVVAGNPIVVVGESSPVTIANGYSQVFYTANGGVFPTITWICLTGDDANSDYSNQMGGSGGALWWGDGIRSGAGTRELSASRWVTGPGGVEQIAIDPANPTHILAAGEQGAYLFDTTLLKCYPAMVGLHGTTNLSVGINPTDDDDIYISDSFHTGFGTKTGGREGAWFKNENGLPTLSGSSFYGVAKESGRTWVGYGNRSDNTRGDVYRSDDPTNGSSWASMAFSANGAKPLGVAVKHVVDPDGIADTDIALVAAQWITGTTTFGGIYKRTYDTATGTAVDTGWTRTSTATMFLAPTAGYNRAIDIKWASETQVYCYDPSSGLWRSDDSGDTWTNIWNATCNTDRQGFLAVEPDDPSTVYVSLGTSATSTNRGIWKLTGADIGTVGTGITKTAVNKPGNVAFVNPGPIAVTTNGRGIFTETNGTNPSVYFSSAHGTGLVDETDPYFQRSARRMTGAAMGTNGRCFITMAGSATLVWDTESSRVGDGIVSPVRTIERFEKLSWSSGSTLASYVTGTFAQATRGPGRLLIADIANSHATAAPAPTSVTGLGLTWTQIGTSDVVTATDGSQRRISQWEAMTDTIATGTLTVGFSGAQSGIAVHVEEYENVEAVSGGGGGTQTVAVTHLANSTSSADSTTYTVGPFTPAANSVIGLAVSAVNTTAGAVPTISSITGGTTYSAGSGRGRAQATTDTDEYKVFFYTAFAGASPSSTTLTVTFSATMEGCDLEVLQFTNADLTTPISTVSVNSGQPAASGTINASLAAAPASTSMTVAVVATRRTPFGWTPDAGWVEQYNNGGSSPINTMYVSTRQGTQTFHATGTSQKFWFVILEVVGAVATGSDPVVQHRNGNWGSTLSKPALTLTSPLNTSGNNAVHFASVTPRFPAAWDPEVGWTEIAELGVASPSVLGVEVAGEISTLDNSFVTATGADARWAAKMIEIAAQNAGASAYIKSYTMDYNVGAKQSRSHTFDFYIISPNVNTQEADFSNLTMEVDTSDLTLTSGTFVAVQNSTNTGVIPQLPTVSGTTGLTWNPIKSIPFGTSGTQRHRLTVFQGIGTPTAGHIRFTVTDCAVTWAWSVIESPSGGTLANSIVNSATGASSVSINYTPIQPTALLIAFAGKRGANLFTAGAGMEELTQTVNDDPYGVLLSEMGSATGPKTVTASSGESTDMGMVLLELSALAASQATVVHDVDYIVFSDVVIPPEPPPTPGTIPPKKKSPRRRLSRVFLTIDGEEVPIENDYQFSETALGGYDTASFSIPASVALSRRNVIEQDAPIVVWDDGANELWTGKIESPPKFKDNLAGIEANGYQHDARRSTDRLMYQLIGTESWAEMDADPYNYDTMKGYTTNITPGALSIRRNRDETFQNNDHDGFVIWVPGANPRKFTCVVNKPETMQNFEIRIRTGSGPSGSLNTVQAYSLRSGSPDPLPDKATISVPLDGPDDLVALVMSANANDVEVGASHRVWFSDVRVNGIANKANIDVFTTSDVAKDIARRLGWDVNQISAQDFNALPLDFVDQDWGEDLDYISLLDNCPWQVLGHNGDLSMRRRPWNYDEIEVAREDGAVLDLTPEPIYDIVRVVYTTPAGKPAEVQKQQGNGRELPPVELSDPQRDNRAARALAERLLDEFGSSRWSGTVTLNSGPRTLHAGRILVISDWDAGDDSLPHQIEDVSQSATEITLGIRAPQISSRFMARIEKKAQRRGRRG